MAAIKLILENHIYSFNGKIYKQTSGGPIGEDITRMSAEIVMYLFVQRYKSKLVELLLFEEVS